MRVQWFLSSLMLLLTLLASAYQGSPQTLAQPTQAHTTQLNQVTFIAGERS